MDTWMVLGIDKTKDKSLIKDRYFDLLTKVNPEDNPEGFKILRAAYEKALEYAKNENIDEDNSDLGKWIEKVKTIYKSFSLRIDINEWNKLLNEDISFSLETKDVACEKLLQYLINNINIPCEVWRLIDSHFEINERKKELYEQFPKEYIDFIIDRIENNDIINYYLFKVEDNKDYDSWINLYFNTIQELNNNNTEVVKTYLEQLQSFNIYHPYFDLLQCRYHMALGDYTISKNIISNLLKNYPNDMAINYYAAELKWVEKNYKHAKELYEHCLDISPNNFNAKVGLADVLLELGELEKSKNIFIDLINIDPYYDYLRERVSYINSLLIAKLDNQLKTNPDNNKLKFKLAWCYYENFNYEKAINLVLKIKCNDKSEIIKKYDILGNSYFDMGSYDNALKYFHKLLKNKKTKNNEIELISIYNKLGRIYSKLKRYDEALKFFDKVLNLMPNNIYYINCKCNTLIKLGKYEECLELSDIGIEVDKNDSLIYSFRAESLYNLGYLKEALDSANRCINLCPYISAPYIIKMKILLDNQENEEVLMVSNEANKYKINDSEIVLCKCEALIKLNRGEEAEDLIKNLLININDSNEENNEIKCKAFYLLSLNELNKDNFNFALELINEAISFNYKDLDSYYLRAYIYRCIFEYNLALNDYNFIINNNGNIAFSYYQCALIFKEIGKYRIAISYFNKVLEIDPDYPNAKEEVFKLQQKLNSYL